MTTATATVALAAKPVRKRRTRAKSTATKPMKEQTSALTKSERKVTPSKDAIAPVVVTNALTMSERNYPLTKPDVELLTKDVLLQDFKNRMAIHHYEIQEVWRDYNWIVDNYVKPITNKVITKVKDLSA